MILQFHPDVYKQLRKLQASVFEPVLKKILELQADPRPNGAKPLVGTKADDWRVRVGEYRVIYEIDDTAKTVTVMKVGHRRDVYQ